ncbi:site-specific integrase [Paenibacillus chitinolyticus]|uniref:Site-specific integrase n=1 Tax=Paenibacillus chitinolyticus TaxID=79263 RepID=A0A410WWH0_9BACL|nr:site-specific integrase [Paenibacillus chitinolyticus]MCY9591447.1 site-specific integrase [Paenibacillus chitinolyticus]MCY9598573.1 site-specific integrase [Paenibacillus chitinolyticus]QAV18799.1 site-specific integrase [Paenibacillus chitinolyticus]
MAIYEYSKRGKIHYFYSFEVKDFHGKRKTIKQKGFTGKREARAAEAEARVEWEKGLFVDPSTITYAEYLKSWITNKHNISPQTRETNEGQIKNHINPVIGNVLLQKLTTQHIEILITSLKNKSLSSGTVKKIFNLVNTSLKSAVKKELIVKNPIDLMDVGSKPAVKKGRVDFWTVDEVKDFLDGLEHRHRIIFVLAIYTGMRRGEILGLRWRDIDLENGQIRISQILAFKGEIKDGAKTVSGNRSISIPPIVVSELRKHRSTIIKEKWDAQEKYKDHDLVVCRKNGLPVSWSNFHKFWLRILSKSNVRPIRFHDLRHTCASLLLSGGIHPKIVQELLGHSSIKITLDTYSHMMPNIQADAVKTLEKMLN